ncbi:hypothetical protein SCLCIDRAFT_1223389 [Scleroderma citrinum Foug A]|uniref:Uncharacterized protein n=1 Tax=Scleroderma citrinum Foug A TaxID=1036808 RepID=A0A0C2YT82_9AGAM|nr:hypothetical protein SCLCIDRAFT_1223389 [Scleroderma citrinum Foug A]
MRAEAAGSGSTASRQEQGKAKRFASRAMESDKSLHMSILSASVPSSGSSKSTWTWTTTVG